MITLTNIHKSYYTEAISLHVLRASASRLKRANTSPSWVHQVRENPRCSTSWAFWTPTIRASTGLNGTLIKDLGEKQAARYRNEMIGFVFSIVQSHQFQKRAGKWALPLYYKNVSRNAQYHRDGTS